MVMVCLNQIDPHRLSPTSCLLIDVPPPPAPAPSCPRWAKKADIRLGKASKLDLDRSIGIYKRQERQHHRSNSIQSFLARV